MFVVIISKNIAKNNKKDLVLSLKKQILVRIKDTKANKLTRETKKVLARSPQLSWGWPWCWILMWRTMMVPANWFRGVQSWFPSASQAQSKEGQEELTTEVPLPRVFVCFALCFGLALNILFFLCLVSRPFEQCLISSWPGLVLRLEAFVLQ
jgi:hypothetical protein